MICSDAEAGLAPSAPGRALRARINVWGLDAQAAGLSSSTGFRLDDNVDSSHVAEAQSSSEDVYLEAESNLIRWLTGIGFLAPEGKFEHDVCDPIIQDILDANRITLDRTLSPLPLSTPGSIAPRFIRTDAGMEEGAEHPSRVGASDSR